MVYSLLVSPTMLCLTVPLQCGLFKKSSVDYFAKAIAFARWPIFKIVSFLESQRLTRVLLEVESTSLHSFNLFLI